MNIQVSCKRMKENYLLYCFLTCITIGVCSCGLPPHPGNGDGPFNPASADLIIKDMYFVRTPAGGDPESPTYDLHVWVKNIGPQDSGHFNVILFNYHKRQINTGTVFERVSGQGGIQLKAGADQLLKWERIGMVDAWNGYYLAVVDIPTDTLHFGQVVEKPIDKGEKNNVFAIPYPSMP